MRKILLPLVGLILICLFLMGQTTSLSFHSNPKFEAFELTDLVDQLKASKKYYLPFLNRKSLRCGLYTLPKGGTDPQSPHQLDEVYYIISGKAKFLSGKEEVKVKEGDVLYVAALEEHHFHSIEEDLQVLVFFSTAEPD